MLGSDVPQERLPADDGLAQLAAVRELLAGADVAFGNLEGVLAEGGEPAKRCANPASCWLFRSPPRFARTLAWAGFDVMSLANNHARDFGEEGRTASMQALAAEGIRHSGREGDVASWTSDGLRVALAAFSPFRGSNSMHELEAAGALAATHEIVIVSHHGGGEGEGALHVPFAEEFYLGENRGDVAAFSRAMVEAGADLVVGHGPHVPRGLEVWQDRLIAYSLGNFATWYGVNVSGDKGLAPLLLVELDAEGRFLRGTLHSHRQERPVGPLPDATGEAYALMARLSRDDFPATAPAFTGEGRIEPRAR
jgi:poly-gamma-glutamate capsule biosynthesis protein CapA/YwtB (metallophosphatase superfamily)